MKKKFFVWKCIAVFMCAVMFLCNLPMTAYASEEETSEEVEDASESDADLIQNPPGSLDFTKQEVQEDVWDVFETTSWASGAINIKFTLGDQGIAFSTSVDKYAEFQNVFEKPLQCILKGLDEDEAKGKTVINTNHAYKLTEYEKIVSSILYCMVVRDYKSVGGNWYTWTKQGEGDPSVSSIVKSIYNSVDEDQREFTPIEDTFYFTDAFENYALNGLGYTQYTVDNALWGELSRAYFGTGGGSVTLKGLVKKILYQLTRFDGKVYCFSGEGEDPKPFYFDVYERQNMNNYVCLDSLFDSGVKDGEHLLEAFVESEDLMTMANEWETTAMGGMMTSDNMWSSYNTWRANYLVEHYDEISIFNYSDKYYQNCPEPYIDIYIYSCDAEYLKNTLPGGSGNGESFGFFYYQNYVANKVANHAINGETGEVIE